MWKIWEKEALKLEILTCAQHKTPVAEIANIYAYIGAEHKVVDFAEVNPTPQAGIGELPPFQK